MTRVRAAVGKNISSVMGNRIMQFDEEKLKEIARPYFALARAGDWEHALRVVDLTKDLGRDRQDLPLLVTAAYLHDIGWSGIAPQGLVDLDEMLELEPKGKELFPKLLSELERIVLEI